MTDTPSPDNVVPETEMARRRHVHELADKIADGLTTLGSGLLKLRNEMGLPMPEIVQLITARTPPGLMEQLQRLQESVEGDFEKYLDDHVGHGPTASTFPFPMPPGYVPSDPEAAADREQVLRDAHERSVRSCDDLSGVRRMRMVIDRLFDEAPKLTDGAGKPVEGQAPALQVHLVMRANIPPIQGVLSKSPEGLLRLMTPDEVPDTSPGARPNTKRRIFMEQFFDYSDVVSICIEREIKAVPRGGLFSTS